MGGVTASANVFRAVADPTRRALLDLLRESDRSVSELARPFRISQPAISQHLRILRKAGLVRARRVRRQRLYRINPRAVQEVYEWAAKYKQFTDPFGHVWTLAPARDYSPPAAGSQGRVLHPEAGEPIVLKVGHRRSARTTPLSPTELEEEAMSIPATGKAAESPLISNVKTVGVYARDQEKALKFYTEKLGFEVRRDEPMGPSARWIELAPRGAQTCIVPFTPPGLESRIGTFANIVFSCKDAEATYEELSARGVEFKEKPTKQPWGGIMAQFLDQDGNTFVLVQE